MRRNILGWAALGCISAAVVLFLLWKLFFLTGPLVPVLARLFVVSLGLGLALGFAFGCRQIFKLNLGWMGRVLLVGMLLLGVAFLSLNAALAMNFAGQ